MNMRDSPYWGIFRDVWGFFKTFAEVQETDEFWERLMSEAETVYRRYENAPQAGFARSLILSAVNEIDRIYREGRDV